MSGFNYVLWKPNVEDFNVRMLDISDLPNSGFRSVYCFTETDAKSIQALESYKSYKGTVHSPTLFIDCDSEEASNATERRLRELHLAFEKFTTGGRGNHYHVPRIVTPSHMLPSIDKEFVKTEFPTADLSFYHHVGLYRQIGARHHKTGNRKELIDVVDGNELDMTGFKPVARTHTAVKPRAGMQSWFLNGILQNFTVPVNRGERHSVFIKIANILDNLGQPPQFALAYLANMNLMAEDPLELDELERILDWSYNQRIK